MNDPDSPNRPVSFIRSTKLPLKRYAVIWTHRCGDKEFVDPIWHVDARDPEHAALLALETERPEAELRVEEDPRP